MSDTTRVPRIISLFDVYVTTSDDHLQADDTSNPGHPNYERLGLSAAQATDWDDRRQEWDDLYDKYGTKGTRTDVVREQVANFMKSFREFANPLLNMMAANPAATVLDGAKLNFKLTRKAPSKRTTQITETIFPSIQSLGGNEFFFSFRAIADSKRASLLKGVDSVIAWYKIVTNEPVSASIEPDETWNSIVFYKSRNTFKTPAGSKGKYLLIAFQWAYTPNRALAGPVCGVKIELIS